MSGAVELRAHGARAAVECDTRLVASRHGGAAPATPRPGRGAAQRGQASVEFVAMLPVAVVVMLTALQFLAAGATRELAGHAAGAGAVALLQRADARDAARDAVPGWSTSRMAITVRGGDVTVRMRPPTLVPGLARLLESTVHARAGKDA